MKNKVFCFDLDNVICLTKKNYYHKSSPINKSINIRYKGLVTQRYHLCESASFFTFRSLSLPLLLA